MEVPTRGITKEQDGSITIYLSLILVLIMAFLFTMLEGARIQIAKVNGERALLTAMDSVLAEFYGPLWEEYHIFGLDADFGSNSLQTEELLQKVKTYMSYTFDPTIDSSIDTKNTNLLGLSIDSLSFQEITYLNEYQGELFIQQAIDYMKYQEVASLVEELLNKISLLNEVGEVSAIYQEKQKVEEELRPIEEGILKLMELLDGVSTSKNGIKTNNDGTLKITNYFVKKISIGQVNAGTTGMNNPSVFQAVRDHYIDPMPYFEIIVTQLDALMALEEEIRNAKEELGSVKEEKSLMVEMIENKEKEMEQTISSIETMLGNVEQLTEQIQPKIDKALLVIEEVTKDLDCASSWIEDFKVSLSQSKEDLTQDIYKNLEEECKALSTYVNGEDSFYDFSNMKKILQEDAGILQDTSTLMKEGKALLSKNNYKRAKNKFASAKKTLETYQIEELKIDYSSLVPEQEKSKNPTGAIKDLVENGMLGLLIDSDDISAKEITNDHLPSVLEALSNAGNGNLLDMIWDVFDEGAQDFFGDYGEDTDTLSSLVQNLDGLFEKYLFQSYLQDSFAYLPSDAKELSTRKPSVLSYEQEYLIAGNAADQENLSSVMMRIVLMRTMLDFVTILGDKDKCNEARLAATAIVGFTGLPILVSITKTLLLIVWAFAEAMVDTSALIQGKQVPILKNNIVLSFMDLFQLNRDFIQTKALEIKAKGISMTYSNYLMLFLLMQNNHKLAFRSMDLMQENINLRYDDHFLIQNCIYGYKINGKVQLPSKFLKIPMISNYSEKTPNGFKFKINAINSY